MNSLFLRLLIPFLCIASVSVHAVTYTWKSGSTYWDDAGSWTVSSGTANAGGPQSGDDVVIAIANATVKFTGALSGQTVTVKSLSLTNGATIDFEANAISLAVSPTVTGVNTEIGSSSTAGSIIGTGSLSISSSVAVNATFTNAGIAVPLSVGLSSGTLTFAGTSSFAESVVASAKILSATGSVFSKGAALTSNSITTIKNCIFGTSGQIFSTSIADNGGGGTRNWYGGTTYYGPTTISYAGSTADLTMDVSAGNAFRGPLTVNNTGTRYVLVSANYASTYSAGITLNNTGTNSIISIGHNSTGSMNYLPNVPETEGGGDITVAGTSSGTVYLGNNGRVSANGHINAAGLTAGTLSINHLTQSSADTIQTGGGGVSISYSAFEMGLVVVSKNIRQMRQDTFGTAGQPYACVIHDIGGGANRLWYGGNVYHGPATISYSASSMDLQMDVSAGSQYHGPLTVNNMGPNGILVNTNFSASYSSGIALNNTGTGGSISLGWNAGSNMVYAPSSPEVPNGGNITVTGTSGTIYLGNSGGVVTNGHLSAIGFTSGTLHINRLVQSSRDTVQTGGAGMNVNYSTFLKGAVLVAPNIRQFRQNTFGTLGQLYPTTITHLGGGGSSQWYGGNTFYGKTTIGYSGSSVELVMAATLGDRFHDSLTVNNTGISSILIANAGSNVFDKGLVLNNKGASGSLRLGYGNSQAEVHGDIVLTSTSTGTFYLGYSGNIAQHDGSLRIGAQGFAKGTLYLNNFVQQQAGINNLSLTGTAKLVVNNSCTLGSESNTGTGTPSVYSTASQLTLGNSNFLGSSNFSSAEITNVNNNRFGSTSAANASSYVVAITHGGANSSNAWGGGNTFNTIADITFLGAGNTTLDLNWGGTGNIHNADVSLKSNTSGCMLRTGNTGTTVYKGNVYVNGNVNFNTGTNSTTFAGGANQTLGLASGASSPSSLGFANSLGLNKTSGKVTIGLPVTVSGTLDLVQGILESSGTNLLSLSATAILSGGNDSSFVSGPMARTGSGPFIYRIGKEGHYAPLKIEFPVAQSNIQAEYFAEAPMDAENLGSPLLSLSDGEYWTVTDKQGNSPSITPTLYWDETQNLTAVPDTHEVVLATRTSGTAWTKVPATAAGTEQSGSLNGSQAVVLANAVPRSFTFGFTVLMDGIVTNTKDSGPGSLRNAIIKANSNPDFSEIRFRLPVGGSRVIGLLSELPAITTPMSMDGTTQPGYNFGDSTTVIKIKDTSTANTLNGLLLIENSGGSSIKGLQLDFSQYGYWLQVENVKVDNVEVQ